MLRFMQLKVGFAASHFGFVPATHVPHGYRRRTISVSELRSCVNDEVDVPGSPPLIV